MDWKYLGVVTPPEPRAAPTAKFDYRAYIKSSAWRALKDIFLRSHLPKNCLGCWKPYQPNFELHHRTYENLGSEKLQDLCLLCRDCHQAVHDRFNEKGGREPLRRATKNAVRAIRKKSLEEGRSKLTRADYRPRPDAGDCDIWRTIGADCPWNPTPGIRVVQHITTMAEARRLGLR